MIVSILDITEILSAAMGLVLVYITYRAGKVYSQRYLYLLSLGFAMISFGYLLEKFMLLILESPERYTHLVESIFDNLGLLVIIYSLRDVKPDVDESKEINSIKANSEEEVS